MAPPHERHLSLRRVGSTSSSRKNAPAGRSSSGSGVTRKCIGLSLREGRDSGSMATVTEPPYPKQHTRPARTAWRYLTVALIAVAIGAVGMLAFDRDDRAGLWPWVSDFMRSPGFAGLAALAAAGLAFTGISRQVQVARENLEQARKSADQAQQSAQESLLHSRRTEQDRAWWNSFEWASSRALPADSGAESLPYVAVLRTFEALAKSATDHVQEAAIAGVMDVAAERHDRSETEIRGIRDERSVLAAGSGEDSEAMRSALAGFVASTRGTPASSSQAVHLLHEIDVLGALHRLSEGDGAVHVGRRGLEYIAPQPNRSIFQPDAVVEIDGATVVVEIKGWSIPVPPMAKNTLEMIRDRGVREPVVIVVSGHVRPSHVFDKLEQSLGFKIVTWRDADDDGALLMALRSAAQMGLRNDLV